MKQHKYIEVQLNDKKRKNFAHEGQMHQYIDEFEEIPTDFMSGNIDSIDMNKLFFKACNVEEQHIEGLLVNRF